MSNQAKKQTKADQIAESAHKASQGKLPKEAITGKTKMVIALDRGYYQQLREPDDIFEVPAHMKGSWFKEVGKSGSVVEDDDEELV